MKYIKLISLVGLFSILLISCGKKSKLGKLIPKEAGVVVDINTKSLLSKLPWDEIKKTYWFNKLISDSSVSAASKTFLNDPSKTGVDLESDILFFMLQPNNNGRAVVEGSLKDGKAFSEFIKTMHPSGAVSKDGELNFLKHEDALVGWNSERFVFVAAVPDHNIQTSDMHDSTKNTAPPTRASSDDLIKACKDIFALNNDNSLYANEKFADLEGEEGDVHFWMNVNELSKGSMKNMPGMMGMVKLDKFLEDNYATATINFQDGKITANQKQYYGKELSDILKKGEGNINNDMIKRLPLQNLAGVFSLHFTPSSMLEIIKLTGLDGFINIFMSQSGITLDDVVKALKGDFVFSVSDITTQNDTVSIKNAKDSIHPYPHRPDATFLFATSIADKDAFNKLLKLGEEFKKDLPQKTSFQKSDDKYFVISNSQEAVNKYFSGTQSDPPFLSKINDHSMGGFVDLQMIMKAMQPELTKDSIGKVYYERNISMWDNVYFKGGDYKDGGIVNSAELNFIDKNTNSLKQLNKYIDDNAKIIIEKREKHKEEWKKDSTVTKAVDSTATKIHKPKSKKRK